MLLRYAYICTYTVLHMRTRFTFSKAFDWYIIRIYKLSFYFVKIVLKLCVLLCQEILETMHFVIKLHFFLKWQNWQLGKYLIYIQLIELYWIYNANLLYTHIFFSIFCVKSYNASAIHSYLSIYPLIRVKETCMKKDVLYD